MPNCREIRDGVIPALNAARAAFTWPASTRLGLCSLVVGAVSCRSNERLSPSHEMGAETMALTLPQSSTVVCVAVWPHRTQPHKARPVHRRSVGLQPDADSWARHDAAWRCQLPAVRQRWSLLPMKKHLA